MRFFRNRPEPGRPISLPGVADGLAAIARALENLTVHNGHVDWTNGVPVIVFDAYEQRSMEVGVWRADYAETEDFRTSGSLDVSGSMRFYDSISGNVARFDDTVLELIANTGNLELTVVNSLKINSSTGYTGTASPGASIDIVCGIVTGVRNP